MVGIYKITNIINNHVYIGKTNNSDRRWQDHQRLAYTPNQKEYDKTLYRAMRKYGIKNFTFEIIEEISIDQYDKIAGEREQYWIQYYDSFKHGYNETYGGAGGSPKGHCKGEENGRAKLTYEDVKMIRTYYSQGISKNDCYLLFKDKISKGGFSRVWLGKTWPDVMPEVFTEQNKKRNAALGRGQGGKTHRILTNEDVYLIRQLYNEGVLCPEIQQRLHNKCSISTIKDVIYNKTYKDI